MSQRALMPFFKFAGSREAGTAPSLCGGCKHLAKCVLFVSRCVEMFRTTNCVKLLRWNPGEEKKKPDNGHNRGRLITAQKAGLFIELLSIKALQAQRESQRLWLLPSLPFQDVFAATCGSAVMQMRLGKQRPLCCL